MTQTGRAGRRTAERRPPDLYRTDKAGVPGVRIVSDDSAEVFPGIPGVFGIKRIEKGKGI